MQLTPAQKRELKIIAQIGISVWPGFPPDAIDRDLDPDFADYVENGIVRWTGKGYRVTAKGLRALDS
ncbi:hypothetical protein [Mesorhizobium denitrificans]|uniref:Uncharacterized protein n=1 Tax=Mesorhizobium denitrificans TaxID=2294114 RepID=A0A371XDV6_9HYPH|nr:hypothetical protein [Mesorhizobium denitrificans]RFC67373.1 hypothetical protein DY251_12610 [Mesorhizobium denitrificans]